MNSAEENQLLYGKESDNINEDAPLNHDIHSLDEEFAGEY